MLLQTNKTKIKESKQKRDFILKNATLKVVSLNLKTIKYCDTILLNDKKVYISINRESSSGPLFRRDEFFKSILRLIHHILIYNTCKTYTQEVPSAIARTDGINSHGLSLPQFF